MSDIVVPPSGLSYPLARLLIGDGAFAHSWLCHNGGECPDGCDHGADPKREALYSGIRYYFSEQDVRSYRRGYEMAAKGQAPIFRKVGDRIEAEIDSDMADEWDDSMRQAYLDGYNAGL